MIFWLKKVSVTFSSLLGGRELLGLFGSEIPWSQLPSLPALLVPFSLPISLSRFLASQSKPLKTHQQSQVKKCPLCLYCGIYTRFLSAPCGRASEACSACPMTKEKVCLVHAADMALVVAVVGHLPLFSCPTLTVLFLSTLCTGQARQECSPLISSFVFLIQREENVSLLCM